MRDLYQLIYCSRNTVSECRHDMDAEIEAILDTSRRNNARDAITGALLFSSGCFAQVLEGPIDTVERAFERIQLDPRHSDTTVLSFEATARRQFADWSMGYAGSAPLGPESGRMLNDALAGGDRGDDVSMLLRSLVNRQDDWLASVA